MARITPTHFCGPKCSHCCFILSLWGIVMLAVLGVLFQIKARALIADAPKNTSKSMESVAMNCYIAAGMYVATAGICYWQMAVNNRKANRVATATNYT